VQWEEEGQETKFEMKRQKERRKKLKGKTEGTKRKVNPKKRGRER